MKKKCMNMPFEWFLLLAWCVQPIDLEVLEQAPASKEHKRSHNIRIGPSEVRDKRNTTIKVGTIIDKIKVQLLAIMYR